MKCRVPVVMALAILLAPAMPVLSEGGGDYPAPASGDWVITQDTWVANETIYLGGDLTVVGANLTLDNVTLLGNLTGALQTITVTEGASISALKCTFDTGIAANLSFELRGSTDIRNCRFTKAGGSIWARLASVSSVLSGCDLEGTLAIADNLSPTLDGTIVRDSEVGVYFGTGVWLANLTVRNCTKGARGEGGSVITDCAFEGRGYDYQEYGLHPGPESEVIRCRFSSSLVGIAAQDLDDEQPSSNVTVDNCEIQCCTIGIASGPDFWLKDCTFNCGVGLMVWGTHASIERCAFRREGNWSKFYYGMQVDNLGSVTITNSTFDGLDLSLAFGRIGYTNVENSSFRGDTKTITIFSGSLFIRNSTFTYTNSSALGLELTIGEKLSYELVGCTFNGTQTVILDLRNASGIISNCSFMRPAGSDPSGFGTFYIAGRLDIRDSAVSGGNGTILMLQGSADCKAVNFSFPDSPVWHEYFARFEAWWYLDATVLQPDGYPAANASFEVKNRFGNILSRQLTEANGRAQRLEALQYRIENNSTTYFTPLSLNASKDGLYRNLSVNLNQNLDLTLTLADVTAPSIHFTSPANNTLLNTTQCTFKGKASDDQGVSSVRLRAGSGDWVVADGTTDWNATLDLLEGENQILAEASDAEGNTATASITVRVDSLPPVVEITYPPQNMLVNATTIELTGRAEPGCTVLVDGEAVPFYMGQFSGVVNLHEGPNTLIVTARDAAGNVGAAAVNVTLDTIPPALTLTSPRNGEVTNQSRAAVSGTAEPGARVLVNGADAVRSGPFFSTEVVLVEGVNSITVQAQDAAGNRASTTIRVILDRGVPFLTVNIQNGTITQSSTIRITGKTKPGATLSVNGVPAEVAPDGNFSADVALKLGLNQIHIEARDPVGNTATLDRTITREDNDRTPPPKISEPARGISPALILGMAVGVIIVLIILFIFLRSRPPPLTDRDDNKSGSRPEGRGP